MAVGLCVEEKIANMGWELVPSIPKANYVSAIRTGNYVFLSGALPVTADGKLVTGKLGRDMSDEEGYEAAKLACLSLLGTLKKEIGTLDNIKAFVKVGGMINATLDFTMHPKVMNGCSDLLYELFGSELGKHTRVAAGFASLPLGVAVEIDMIVEVEPNCEAA